MVQIAIMGFGTIGSGVYDVINTNQAIIQGNLGKELRVKYVLDLREFPGDPVESILVHDVNVIINDPEVDIVVETMGGEHPAFEFVSSMLKAGKSVVTSNKNLVAAKGVELMRLAVENNVNFMYEASVGGGIPIIRPLTRSVLPINSIDEITGILNGTTNYILTKMYHEGSEMDAVLKEAQDKGYAERNPEADVEGYDACRKIAILGSIVTGKQIDYQSIPTEGITAVTKEDMIYARRLGRVIRLLGTCRRVDGTYYAEVAPYMVGSNSPLFAVNGVFNGIMVHGNMLDTVMFYGQGAGSHPTASAVMSDVVDAAAHTGRIIYPGWGPDKLQLGAYDEWKHVFLLRFRGDASQKAAVEAVVGPVQVVEDCVPGETGFITGSIANRDVASAAKLDGFISRFRIKR
jgi:homoserine dehydrogenase